MTFTNDIQVRGEYNLVLFTQLRESLTGVGVEHTKHVKPQSSFF